MQPLQKAVKAAMGVPVEAVAVVGVVIITSQRGAMAVTAAMAAEEAEGPGARGQIQEFILKAATAVMVGLMAEAAVVVVHLANIHLAPEATVELMAAMAALGVLVVVMAAVAVMAPLP